MVLNVISQVSGKICLAIISSRQNGHPWISGLVSAGRHLVPHYHIDGTDIGNYTVSNTSLSVNGCFACLAIASYLAQYSCACFSDLPAIAVITLWTACYRFGKIIQENLDENNEYQINKICNVHDNEKYNSSRTHEASNWHEIYSLYKILRQLSHMINRTFGTAMFLYIGISILESTITLQSLPTSSKSDIIKIFDDGLWLIFTIIILTLAANVTNQVNPFNIIRKKGYFLML